MGFLDPPQICAYIEGQYVFSEKLKTKLKKRENNRRNFFIFNIFIGILTILLGAFIFNWLFNRMFKRIMHDRIDEEVERSINSYRAMESSDNNSIELAE